MAWTEADLDTLKAAILEPERMIHLGNPATGKGVFPYTKHATWVGNWCWDELKVTLGTAADVTTYCLRRGYRPLMNLVCLSPALDRRTVTTADLMAAMGEVVG